MRTKNSLFSVMTAIGVALVAPENGQLLHKGGPDSRNS